MMAGYAFYGNEHVVGCLEERLASAGLSRVEEAADAAFVLSYCTTMTELEDLYFGEAGLLSTLAEGTVVVDMSPVTPNFANEMNAVTTISGYKIVTAPLIVKDRVAAHALDRENLRCACFGEDGSQEDAAAMLDAIFSEVETVGSAGAAQLIRSAATIQESARIVSAVEALALFKSARSSMSIADTTGADLEEAAPEASFMVRAVAEKRFNGDYTVEMMMAELSSVMMAADDYELILPQVESAFHLLELLAIIGGAAKSPAALSLVYGSDREGDAYGLDWSKANALYAEQGGMDEDAADEDPEAYEDEDEYLDELFGTSSGFSSN